MARKTFLTKFKKLHESYDLPSHGQFLPAITRQQIELESYSNPLNTREVLYFRIKKNFKFWVWGFWSMMSELGYILQFLYDIIAEPMNRFIHSKFFGF